MRIGSAARGLRLGGMLVTWCVDRARGRGCALVQVTSDATPGDAHRFYEHLGFRPTHVGFKLVLGDPPARHDAVTDATD